LDNEKEEDKDT